MVAILTKSLNGDDRLLLTGLGTVSLETGLSSYLTGAASVEATVLDRDTQEEIVGETWPLALTYITASDGNFHGPLRDSLVVQAHQFLDVVVVIDAGDDQRRTLVLPCIVQIDRGS